MKRFPLSKTEYGIYAEQISTGNTAYNLPYKVTLGDEVDLIRLSDAVRKTVEAHRTLKTAFAADENGEIYKYIRDGGVDVNIIEAEDIDLYSLVKPFDLHNDVLFRFYIIKSSKGNTLFYDIHHIVFDGTSNGIMLSDISRAYFGEEVETEKFTANDFALEETKRIQSEEYDKAKAYYQKAFDGVDTDSSFYTDKNDCEPVAKETVYPFSRVDSDALKALATKYGVKLSTVFNGAFSYLLARYTGSEQALYSTVHHGRDERLADTVGMFVKTYPVHADLSSEDSVEAFLKKLDAQISLNRENDLYSFADFCADTKLIPNILFAYQGDLMPKINFCGCEVQPELMPMKDSKSGFELTVRRNNGRFFAYTLYQQDLYDDEIVRGMLESFDKVLAEMLVKEKLSDIDMLTDAQLAALDAAAGVASDYEITDIVTLFRRQAEKTPDNTAVVYLDRTYTYKEVDRITENIAAFLRSKGVGKNHAVSVLIPRCEYMPIAAVGILKAGAGYQPLDASYPSERLEFMIQDADAKYLIADRGLMDRIPNYKGPVLYTDEIPSLPDADRIPDSPEPSDLFIMLYTSGSTGVPKGVMLEHHNLCCFCNWYIDTYKMDETSRALAYASYGFDAHMIDMYPTLLCGGQLHIIDESIRLNLIAINQYCTDNDITHMFMTTQVGRQYADVFPDATNPRHLSVGGERLVPVAPPRGFQLHNAYGPTECTIFTHMYPVDKLYERVPIGKPLYNMKQYVVDKKFRRVPFGVPGELIVAGHQVGRGYLNRPEKNAEVFIRNPFSDEPGYEHAYRTGDIVRILGDGSVDFIGRNDGQVKIRGFRIELSEVEGVIRKFPGIQDATVQAFDEAGGGKYIAAYVVSDGPVDVDALGEFIKKDKPAYMVPAVTMQIDRIPLNQNQKVNKRALPIPEKKAEDTVPPQNETQQKIFDCVADVIGTASFGITTDIFDAGLTSIGAIKLNVLLSNAFDVPVSIKDLRAHTTVQSLERFFAQSTAAEVYDIQPDYPITQTQNGIFVECAANPNSTIYNIPFLINLPDNIDIERLKKAVVSAVDAHPYLKTVLFMNEAGDIRAKRNDDEKAVVNVIRADSLPAMEELVSPYHILGDRLYRADIYVTPEGNYLYLDIHHIVCDGGSEQIIFDDISAAYDGTAPEKETYTAFEAALTEEILRKTDRLATAKAYYDSVFKGCDAECMPKPDRSGEEKSSGFLNISSDLMLEDISRWCRENNTSENAFFNAVFGYTLSRYGFSEETVYTTIYNGRSDSRFNRAVGMFVKTLPVYCNTDGNIKTTELVAQTGDQLMSSMENDIYSFAEISRAYDIKPDVSFAYQAERQSEMRIGGEICPIQLLSLDTAKFPFALDLSVYDGKVEVSAEYRSDMFSEALVRGFIDALLTAAKGFTAETYLKDVRLVSPQQEELIRRFNATDYPVEMVSVNRLFEAQAAADGDRTAVIAAGKSVTYAELNEAANKIAHSLLERHLMLGEKVGMLLPRTADAVAAEYGILKAGGAFLPMLPNYPDDRIDYCLKDSESRFVITTDDIIRERTEFFRDKPYTALSITSLYENSHTENPNLAIPAESLAYCIYTSGSTGVPKGVMIEHGNLCNFVNPNPLNHETVNFVSYGKTALSVAALSFDFSLMEIHISLCNGMTLCIASQEEIHNPLMLLKTIEEHHVDVISGTPSFVSNLVDASRASRALRQVKMYDLGAEAFPKALYERLRSVSPDAVIVNGYGPTEATISCISKVMDDSKIVTIGKPAANVRAYIIDRYRNLLPVGARGELVIGGKGVGRGYVNLPEKTAESFFTLGGERAYRSGDVARFMPDGEIEFFGRLDNQVKLRGLRVELDEISGVMGTYPGIKHTIVVVRGEGEQQYLCAYFTSDGERIDTARLTEHLKKSLAYYMIPSVFVQLSEIPLTANGKIDKKALPEPEFETKERDYTAPKTDLQKKLCDMFAYALGTDKVGVTDNFFEFGGTSLTASKIAMKAMMENMPIAFKDIFDYPTVLDMEKYINSKMQSKPEVREEMRDTESSALSHNTPAFVDEVGKTADIGNILLTGATGFLGIHVLKYLLDETDKTVYCLLRATGDTVEDKLKNMLMYYFGDPMTELFDDRIRVMQGDITDKASVFATEPYDFTTVINCAACVKHFVQDDTLDRVNWHGVENLIDFCVKTSRRLVHISTVSVAGTGTLDQFSPDRKIHENELYFGQHLDNKYTNTKFKAEQVLLKAVEDDGLDGKIIRVGNLMSRYSDGEFQINFVTNNFMRSIRAYARLGMIPVSALDEEVEFSPIDCTAKAVVTLAAVDRQFTVFHATNGHHVQMGDVVEALRSVGVPIQIVSDSDFDRAFDSALSDEKMNEVLSPLISYQGSEADAVEFWIDHDNSFTTKALYRLGFKWPIINEEYLKNAFIALEGFGFFSGD